MNWENVLTGVFQFAATSMLTAIALYLRSLNDTTSKIRTELNLLSQKVLELSVIQSQHSAADNARFEQHAEEITRLRNKLEGNGLSRRN